MSRVLRSGLIPRRCYTIREKNASGTIVEVYLGKFVEHDGLTDSYNFETRSFGGDQLAPDWPYFTPTPCVSNSASSADVSTMNENPHSERNPITTAADEPQPVAPNMFASVATSGSGAANYSPLTSTNQGGVAIATSGMSNDPQPVEGTGPIVEAGAVAPAQRPAKTLFGCPTRGGCVVSRKTRRKHSRRRKQSRRHNRRRM
jgi:hypothetical protein